jgi:hypothetical protein
MAVAAADATLPPSGARHGPAPFADDPVEPTAGVETRAEPARTARRGRRFIDPFADGPAHEDALRPVEPFIDEPLIGDGAEHGPLSLDEWHVIEDAGGDTWPCVEPWTWQVLPEGLLYRSYLAGPKEPRLGTLWAHEAQRGWFWDLTLGGRVGLLRYGTPGDDDPQGWQWDVEGAAFPRLNVEEGRDLDAADFRGGFPLTYGTGPWEFKLAYYHLSAHLGDEFLERVPDFPRRNYVRDALVAAAAYRLWKVARVYGEAGYAFNVDGGSEPWEVQFGAELSPTWGADTTGAPFAAVNAHLRQEVDFGGNLVVQAGWQWRAAEGRRLLRVGLEYLHGKTPQFEFLDQDEEHLGLGVWYDY